MKSVILIIAISLIGFCRAEALETRLHPTVMIGSGVMFERGNDNVSESTRLPFSFGIGARLDQWSTRLEYSSFRTTDGNATVSTSRALETALAWGAFEFGRNAGWTPYVAAGVGMLRTSTETRLAQSFETARGSWSAMFSLAAGFRGEWLPRLFVRPELRYESSESFKTKDARMGAFVQLDLIF